MGETGYNRLMDSRLPTHVLVTATIRNAADAGVTITVLRKGDASRGTLNVLLDDRAGTVVLHQQIFDGTRPRFIEHSRGDAVAPAIARIRENDPDAWIIEVEDRDGRLWFDKAFEN